MTTLNPSRWIAAACVAFLPIVAAGHHSFASNFDVHTMSELEGEIMNLQWKNPHVVFLLRTSNAQGEEILYQIESHSLSIMRRNGVPADALHNGDKIRIAGHPGRRVANSMFVQRNRARRIAFSDDNNGRCFNFAQHIALTHITNGPGTADIAGNI